MSKDTQELNVDSYSLLYYKLRLYYLVLLWSYRVERRVSCGGVARLLVWPTWWWNTLCFGCITSDFDRGLANQICVDQLRSRAPIGHALKWGSSYATSGLCNPNSTPT
jgi:hypothetical protein